MEIIVKTFATLSQFQPENSDNYPAPDDATVQDIRDELNIPVDELRIIFVNGVHATLETPLKNGDRVGFFPAVGGG
ncbi:MAG: MoaD/ThiS family protein [Desulfovibrio sp.]